MEPLMEVPAIIELKVGEKYTFKLKGQAAAGYIWNYTIDETRNVVMVSTEMLEPPGTEKGRVLPPGYSLDELVTIQALELGHATIRFIQCRSWEKDKPPLKEYTLEIYVKS